jgi:peptide/nickel transport system substrate-binding protein
VIRRWSVPAVLASVIALAGCASSAPPPSDRTIVVAITSSPSNLDPGVGLDETSQKLHHLLFSSLLRIDADLRVVPDLAVRFETADSRTFDAEIPAGIRFHDGREMTAADVVFTFRRFLDPAFASPRKGAYRELEAVEATGRYSVAFRLREPSASFPINLVMGIVPDGTGPDAGRRPVGSGPYRIRDFVPDDHVTLDAFADYYQGRPANDALVFKVVPDDTMRGLELRKGSVDMVVNDLGPDLVHGLQAQGRLQVVTAPGTDYAYVGVNLRDPVLADRRVRRAIAYAIDQQAIVTHLRRGLAEPAVGLVPPVSWAYAADAERLSFDPARARALLDEAGYRDPDGDGPAPRLRLSLKTSTNEAYRLQAAVLQQQLAEVGVALDLRSYELATLFADVARGNVQLYTLQFVGITDPDMLRRVFHSSQTPPGGFNRGHYANPEVDRLIEAATGALDPADRLRFYQQAQRVIAADAPIISLWVKTNVAVAQAGLSGIALNPIADFGFLRHVARAPRASDTDRKDP